MQQVKFGSDAGHKNSCGTGVLVQMQVAAAENTAGNRNLLPQLLRQIQRLMPGSIKVRGVQAGTYILIQAGNRRQVKGCQPLQHHHGARSFGAELSIVTSFEIQAFFLEAETFGQLFVVLHGASFKAWLAANIRVFWNLPGKQSEARRCTITPPISLRIPNMQEVWHEPFEGKVTQAGQRRFGHPRVLLENV